MHRILFIFLKNLPPNSYILSRLALAQEQKKKTATMKDQFILFQFHFFFPCSISPNSLVIRIAATKIRKISLVSNRLNDFSSLLKKKRENMVEI